MSAVLAAHSYAVTHAPCGSARMTVAGEAMTLRSSGALWLEAAATLVVADVHFEKGSAFAARGQMLPPFDTKETLRRLTAEARATAATRIVFLGDAFHDGKAEARMSDGDRQGIEALAREVQLVWIVGNHDAEGPKALPGEVIDDLAYSALILRHEPAPGAAPGEIAGHLHPCARVAGKGASVRRRCFVTDGERLILPAFGAYAGGLNVRDQAFSGLFVRAPIAIALGQTKAHPVRWGQLVGD